MGSEGGLSCLIWSTTPWRSWAIWSASVRPWPEAANCSIEVFASAQMESAWATKSVLPWLGCVSVGTTIGVSGELSPPQAESAIATPTAAAGTQKVPHAPHRARKVAGSIWRRPEAVKLARIRLSAVLLIVVLWVGQPQVAASPVPIAPAEGVGLTVAVAAEELQVSMRLSVPSPLRWWSCMLSDFPRHSVIPQLSQRFSFSPSWMSLAFRSVRPVH